jgi:hypothetical protein
MMQCIVFEFTLACFISTVSAGGGIAIANQVRAGRVRCCDGHTRLPSQHGDMPWQKQLPASWTIVSKLSADFVVYL